MMFMTAPGTKVTRYGEDGDAVSERYITMPKEDVRADRSPRTTTG